MIKKLMMASVMALAVSGAYAQTNIGSGDQTNASTTAVSGSTASNQGNAQSITFTSPPKTESINKVEYSGTQTLKNVPSVSGPALTTSNDTCMGSTSGSVNGPGFGIGLGTTWTDDNCVMLKNSRELWNMGMKAASMALMCTDHRTRAALEVTGFACPNHIDGSRRGPAATPVAEAPQEKYTDPIIRARLGLPPLASAK